MPQHLLPSKAQTYLKRLSLDYETSGEELLHGIISGSRVSVEVETSYDNWDGGTYGHDVHLFLPEEVLRRVPLSRQSELSTRIQTDLNECAKSVDNEFFRSVVIELADESDPVFQKATPFSRAPAPNPDALSIWKPGLLRLFISHRDEHKAEANRLAVALESFGVTSFVAHDTIEPLSTWQVEIHKGLQTMEVMLALVTDNFHESVWTNQEIGYALGKSVPVLALKLGRKDPSGFIGSIQAMKGELSYPEGSALDIYKLIARKLGQRSRLQRAIIATFCASPDFNESKLRFDRMRRAVDALSIEEAEQIADAFYRNDQLYNCMYLINHNARLKKFLEAATGEEIVIYKKIITIGDNIPF